MGYGVHYTSVFRFKPSSSVLDSIRERYRVSSAKLLEKFREAVDQYSSQPILSSIIEIHNKEEKVESITLQNYQNSYEQKLYESLERGMEYYREQQKRIEEGMKFYEEQQKRLLSRPGESITIPSPTGNVMTKVKLHDEHGDKHFDLVNWIPGVKGATLEHFRFDATTGRLKDRRSI